MRNYFVYEINEWESDYNLLLTEKSPQEIFDEHRFRKGAPLFDLFIAEVNKPDLDEDEAEKLSDFYWGNETKPSWVGKCFVSAFTIQELD
jgi:hypothetical protein